MTPPSSKASSQTTSLVSLIIAGTTATTLTILSYYVASQIYRKKKRSKWQTIEERNYGNETLHSIIGHFKCLTLTPETPVEEANKRRTLSYYEKARDAHANATFVPGISSKRELLQKRRMELDLIFSYAKRGDQSHRTVISMCDSTTSQLLHEARCNILEPLKYNTDMETRGVWIPESEIIPLEDMHVTVAIPWWWHTIADEEENYELSKKLAARFRQTLILKFHYPFQIELERIVLLGGKVLVALWRCVGERTTEDGIRVYDRHGESVDPFVKLRQEIVRCFTTESPDMRRQKLTYIEKKAEDGFNNSSSSSPVKANNNQPLKTPNGIPKPKATLKRQNTIEEKTPGLGQGDGFIHTTLCRLPLSCLSQNDVELGEIHRLCREASATLSGHRMVISKFRFLETTGAGGQSNPCIDPIYDETIDAPTRVSVDIKGVNKEDQTNDLHAAITIERNQTIGAVRNFSRPGISAGFFEDQQYQPPLSSENGTDAKGGDADGHSNSVVSK